MFYRRKLANKTRTEWHPVITAVISSNEKVIRSLYYEHSSAKLRNTNKTAQKQIV